MRSHYISMATLLSLLVLLSIPGFIVAKSKKELTKEYRTNSRRAAPRDAFPVLNNPEMVPAEKSGETPSPNEWVIGIEHNGEAKAYPVGVMGFHELANDVVGGRPIVVGW